MLTNFELHRSTEFGVDCLQFGPQLFFVSLDSIAVFPVQLLSYQDLTQFSSSNIITTVTRWLYCVECPQYSIRL